MTDAPENVSQGQFASRLRVLLPTGWFPIAPQAGETERAPVLNALLQGAATVFQWAWGLLQYVYPQQRLATATGAMLEIYAQDFFGDNLPRNPGESDDSYRARIKKSLIPLRFTRPAIEAALQESWPDEWVLIEPRNSNDTKGMASLAAPAAGGGYGYATSDTLPAFGAPTLRYGTRLNPFQGFVLLSGTPVNSVPSVVADALNKTRAGGVIFWASPEIVLPDPPDDFGNDIL